MSFFYSHLIEIEPIIIELDQLGLSSEQKLHLAHLIDSSLHHIILGVILSELSNHDKKTFLNHLRENHHSEIWQFLNDKVDNIEELIKKAVDDLKLQLHQDLKEASRK